MMWFKGAVLAGLFLAAIVIGHPAHAIEADSYVGTGTPGPGFWQPVTPSNPVPVAGTFSASLSGFTPGGTYASLTATGSSASVALPLGVTVQFQNTGTTAVSCTLGIGSATALANELIVQPSSTKTVAIGANTFGACIDQTGSASNLVVLAGGSGLGNDSGGGSSSGSGGAVTIADGANVTQGAIADTAWSGTGNGTIDAILKAIYTKLASSLAVTGTFWQATQPVSLATAPTTPVTGTFWQTTQPVSLASVNITPTDCSGTITTGGTAQSAIAAQTTLHGFTVMNIDTSAGSGEPLWMSFTTTAAASTAASYPLAAPTATTFASTASFTTPPGFGTNHAVSIIGATTGHKFSCTWW